MHTWTKKHVIQAIVEECDENLTVSKDLVSFTVNLYQLNSEWKIENDEDCDKFVSTIVEKLLERHPSILTIEMQMLFTKNYSNKNEIVKKYRHRLERKSLPLITEICETRRVNTDRDIEKLYQKILVFITFMSGLGNPMYPEVLKEAAMCFQSVYLPSEVANFVTLSRKAKDKQLFELMSIVGGIRIFNKDCQRGGQGIDDLPLILQENFEKLKTNIFQLLQNLMKTVNYLTTAIENSLNLPLQSELKKEQLFRIIGALIVCRQQEIYVRKLLADTETAEDEFKSIMRCLQPRLSNLHETVKFRTAIPIVQVYPQFIDLANTWMHLQDIMAVLNHLNTILSQLENLNFKDIQIDDEILESFCKDSEILSDAERLEKSMGKLINECGDCPIFYPNTMNDLVKIHLEFLGFCAWTFVACPGALIPGNPNIGVVKWRTRYFAFSSDEAARQFGKDPNKHFYEALNFVRRHPEYINFFQLHEEIETINSQEKSSDEYSLKFHQDQEIQTDCHFYPSYIDPNYHHSLWGHRKDAAKMADIFQCRTKSTQTDLSHFKRTINIQVSMTKNASVQTRRDNQCNTILERGFFWGLRGRKNCQPFYFSYNIDP